MPCHLGWVLIDLGFFDGKKNVAKSPAAWICLVGDFLRIRSHGKSVGKNTTWEIVFVHFIQAWKIRESKNRLGGGFRYVLFSPLLGEMIPLGLILFKGVEITNQIGL